MQPQSAPNPPQPYQQPYQQPPVPQYQPQGAAPGKIMAIIGFVLAVLGLFVPFAVAGFILSLIARIKSKRAGRPNGLALAGIIVSIVTFTGGILLAVLVWLAVFMSGSVQAEARSTAFMSALSEGNVTAATASVDSPDAGTETFLQSYASDAKGNSYSLKDSTQNEDKYYFLYTTQNPKNKYARTTVTYMNGKYVVVSFVFSSDALALVPTVSANQGSSSAPSQSSVAAGSTSTACLAFKDYETAFGVGNAGLEEFWTTDTPRINDIFFASDSLEYNDYLSVQDLLSNVTALYQSNPSKNYTIHIEGSVATTAQADLAFANQRAEKIKSALIAGGVAESKIVIDEPINISRDYSSPTEQQQRIARRVQLKILPGADC